MAAPVDAGRAVTNITTAADPWASINLPASIAAGDLLIAYFRIGSATSLTDWTGWTQAVVGGSDASDDFSWIYYKVAAGTEGTTAAGPNFASTAKGAMIVWRITGAQKPSERMFDISTVAIGTGANPDPGSVTPGGGTDDYLFIEIAGLDGETQTFTASTNYSNIQNANSGTGGAAASNVRIGGATRGITATSAAENPGTMTAAAPSTGWEAWTLCIKQPNTQKAGTDSATGTEGTSTLAVAHSRTDTGQVDQGGTSAGPNSPGSGSQVNRTSGTSNWTNPGNVTADDNNKATSSGVSVFTHWLYVSNFGFSIPGGATVTGVEIVQNEGYESLNPPSFGSVTITKDGVDGNEGTGSVSYENVNGNVTYGGPGNKFGFSSISGTEANSSTFGIFLWVGDDAQAWSWAVDYFSLKLYYNTGGAGEVAVTASDSSAKSGTDSGSGSETAKINTWGTFESTDTAGGGIFPWLSYQGPTLSRDTTTKYAGTGSLKVVTAGAVSSAEGAYVGAGYVEGVASGDNTEFHLMFNGGNGTLYQAQIDEYNSAGTYLRSTIQNFVGTGSWQYVQVNATLGASAASIGANVATRYGNFIATTFYVDEAFLISKTQTATDSGSGADASALAAAIPATDTGTGADSSTLVAVYAATDTGVGTETSVVDLTKDAVDSGAGSDASALAAAYALTDTGAGTEVGSVEQREDKAGTDAGSGAEASALAVALPQVDSGAGVDAFSALAAVLSATEDTGSGTDTGAFDAAYAATDTGAGTDSATVGAAALSTTDTGTGDDVSALVAAYAATDTGSGADASALVADLAAVDSGAGLDSSSVETTSPDKVAADSGAGTDASALTVDLPQVDSGSAADASTLTAVYAATDTGSGTDVATLTVLWEDLQGNYRPDDSAGEKTSTFTVTQSSWGDTLWTNATSAAVLANDTDRATVSLLANTLSEDIRLLDLPLTVPGRPTYISATVSAEYADPNARLYIQITKDGVNSWSTQNFGLGPFDGRETRSWNLASNDISIAEMESANFGFLLYFDSGATAATAAIDRVEITVRYEQEAAALDRTGILDSGTGADSITDRELVITDSGAGTDASTLVAVYAVTDDAAGTDSGSKTEESGTLVAGSDSGVGADEITVFARQIYDKAAVAWQRSGHGSYAVPPQYAEWYPGGNDDWVGFDSRAFQDDFPYDTYKATVTVSPFGISDYGKVTYFPGLYDNWDPEWAGYYASPNDIPIFLAFEFGTIASQSGCTLEARLTRNGVPFGNYKSTAIPAGSTSILIEADVNGSSWYGGTPWASGSFPISGGDLHDPQFGIEFQVWSNRSTSTTVDITRITLNTVVVTPPFVAPFYGTIGEKGALQFAASDTGTGSDSSTLQVTHNRTDQCSSAEAEQWSDLLKNYPQADSGVGTDSAFVSISLASTDTAAGADASLLEALIGRTDTGSATELITGMGRLASDSAVGVESLGSRVFGAVELISVLDVGDADWALGNPAPLQTHTLTPAPLQTQTFGSVAVGSQTLTEAPLQTQSLTAAPLQDQDLNPIDYEPQ